MPRWVRVLSRSLRVTWKLLIPLYYYSRAQKAHLSSSEAEPRIDAAEVRHADLLLKRIVEMGPTFIKFGQILASRPDILPTSYLQAFSTLHDEVPGVPFAQVKKEVESELGPLDEVFESFDETPVAAASLGQVHRAVLRARGEKEVAVKVRRPGIVETVSVDVIVLKRLSPFLGAFLEPYQTALIERIIQTFSRTIFEEMDFQKEAQNLLRIKKNLSSRRKDVVVPDLVPEFSRSDVLVMEYVPGIKVTDVAELERAGIDRKELSRRVNTLFLEMVVRDDVFHADPHPGNISVRLADGKIVLYDYGMVGALEDSTRRRLIRLYFALLLRNPQLSVERMIDLGRVNPGAPTALVRRGIELAFETWEGGGVNRTNLNELIRIANLTLGRYPIHLPSDTAQLMRLSDILEGVCLTVDPQTHFIDNVFDVLSKSGDLDRQISEEADEAVNDLWNSLFVLPKLPGMIYNTLSDIDNLLQAASPRNERRFAVAAAVATLVAVTLLYADKLFLLSVAAAAIGSSVSTYALLSRRRRARTLTQL
jgi:predicted unusual protein kinase regulating ubiquinone biosynthesis (AarF/ABC1/UbiB family)